VAGFDTFIAKSVGMRVVFGLDATVNDVKHVEREEELRCNPQEIYVKQIRTLSKSTRMFTSLYTDPGPAARATAVTIPTVIIASDTAQVNIEVTVPEVYYKQPSERSRSDNTLAFPREWPNTKLKTCTASVITNFPRQALPTGKDEKFLIGVPSGVSPAGDGMAGGGNEDVFNGEVMWLDPLPPRPGGATYPGTITLIIEKHSGFGAPREWRQSFNLSILP
jgi:hypothetical protein